ncbi:Hypothetical predicted protein [Lecanosticta acicola]|uniref:Nicotinamide-nucleotide adenylyltransferase n=1 Tax=Lecanosticta acicola TaxID=111012 RepID=A0AAI8Z988_9PEZI|nr:Hypothetical predicted protein [Lecanosticta acicola]
MASSSLKSLRNLIPEMESALKSFQSSQSQFIVLRTVNPQGDTKYVSPKTLFILDSSFNPPSIAHRTLAKSALTRSVLENYESPHRLLLLFAVMNADKAPSPAAFEQRLSMMTVFAHDLLESLSADSQTTPVPVDIGVTTAPYYTDKSSAIETEGAEWYPTKPIHVHLVGFDTLTRFFAAKYYQKFNPPFSALNPYFDAGHRLRVTLRPDDDHGSVDEQRSFHKRLEDGEMEKDGAKKEWANQVELVSPNPKAGVSSTKIRRAAKSGDWETVKELCTPSVAEWVQNHRLYEEDATGAKMA